MKKLLSLLVVPAFALAVLGTSVSAQSTNCSDFVIENTGPGSVNQIVCSDSETVVIQCSNGTVINIDVNQDANSGNAENDGNTNGGGATSGDTNNESNLDINVDNECGSTNEAPVTPTTPVTPAAATPVPAAVTPAKVTPKVSSLPETGETTPLMIVSAAVAAVAAIAVAAKIGLAAYAKSVK